MGDEDVIRRRLLIDGDGTGDDRRLNVLLKSFIKWTNEPPETSHVTHDRMLAQLAQCEFAVNKSRLSGMMSAAELHNYENLSHQIAADIEQAKQDIENCKLRVQEAKTVRKNRIEYDVMAKVINEQPDRKATDQKLTQLRKELRILEEIQEHLEKKLDERRKQFHVLVSAIHDLQTALDEDDERKPSHLDTAFDDDSEPTTLMEVS